MRFDQLPHKMIIYSTATALAIFATGYLSTNNFHFWNNTRVSSIQNPNTAQSTSNIDTDSDNDGLPDWKEQLFGSDMHNPDTDGDGTKDGDEVLEGRDPTKKGPDDKLTYLTDPNFATSSTDISGIKKEFFATYLAERSKEIQGQTVRDLVAKIDYSKFRPKNELMDLHVSSDNSANAVRLYVNEFSKITQKYSVRAHRTEDEILADMMKTKNKYYVKELNLPIISYQNFSNDLKALSVPSSLAQTHLLIINGYEGMSKGLMGMKEMFNNPVEGAAGYQSYSKYKIDVTAGYVQISVYIKEHGMVFSEEEPGYPFYWETLTGTTSPSNV